MNDTYEESCQEYRALSRRQFFQGAGAALLTMTTTSYLPRIAFAQSPGAPRDVLVSIFLRGGADGMTLCVPYAEDPYYEARPTLAIPRPDANSDYRALDLDGFFGFPQPFTYLMPAYQAGHLLVVHAAGSADGTRSHFDAQRFMEVGKANDPGLLTGWLGRHLLSVSPLRPEAPLRAVGINYGLQQILQGAPNTLPIPNLDQYEITGSPQTLPRRVQWIQDSYARATDPLKAAAMDTQNTLNLLEAIDFQGYKPAGGAVYPVNPFGVALKSSAALINADVGVEVVHMDIGGWDTHGAENPFDGGLAEVMRQFARGVGAFYTDMINRVNIRFTLLAISEFGRALHENGSIGTDHGHGGVIFLVGPHIAGGRVLADWPGLEPEQLYQGQDLQVTTDYRDVLGEIIAKRLGNSHLEEIFPDYTPVFRGVTTP
jgi:uncharacterized protein (DUF1501 family)